MHRDRPSRRETTESMGDKDHDPPRRTSREQHIRPGVGAVITIFLAGLAITSAVIAWLYLLVRKALLLVAIVFAPPRPVRIVVGRHEGWISKWAMLMVALICSKLVLVVLFLVAIAQITAPINGVLCSISDRWPGWC